jgi:hypothetical protein
MPQEDDDGSQMNKPLKILRAVFITNHQEKEDRRLEQLELVAL